ncbi:MAG: 50S ribosomal protein L11 methyltransferase [Betaproteobacteria bacterium]|nr:50S ribosomal protein L11 methyltransferase [Betaproteobacteria bacterium]
MAWVSLILRTDARLADELSDALLAQGALSVSVEDANAGTAAEVPVYGEPGMPVKTAWPQSLINALCEQHTDPAQLIAVACTRIGLAQAPDYRVEQVAEQDWVRRSQSQFEPIRISDKLWIVPSWAVAPEPDALNLVLDPGLAFGTGSHPSTRLCLQWLERTIRGGERVLDYGCGCGILAIAALRLGANAALGVDVDPLALLAAQANARRNRVDARFINTETAPDFQADLVVANILANPLILLAPLLAGYTGKAGRVALSGILETQAQEVMAAYAPWFAMRVVDSDGYWALLEGLRA